MLMPKKVKFRKSHRGRMTGMSKGARTVDFGLFGLEALEPAWITSQQIEALRVSVARRIKKSGKFFLRMFLFLDLQNQIPCLLLSIHQVLLECLRLV